MESGQITPQRFHYETEPLEDAKRILIIYLGDRNAENMTWFKAFTSHLLSSLTNLTMYEVPFNNKINISTYPQTTSVATSSTKAKT